MTFGDRLRKLRKQLDMTQEQVAKNLNIVRSTYAYYETGKTCPDFNTVVRLARLFNVTTDFLLDADTATPTLQDPSTPIYKPSAQPPLGNEWSLRESEQKLVIAFRYLTKQTQSEFLNSIEQAASEQYEQRRNQRQNRGVPENSDSVSKTSMN